MSLGGKPYVIFLPTNISLTPSLYVDKTLAIMFFRPTNGAFPGIHVDNTRPLASDLRQKGKHLEGMLRQEGLHEDNNFNIRKTSCMACQTLWSGCHPTQQTWSMHMVETMSTSNCSACRLSLHVKPRLTSKCGPMGTTTGCTMREMNVDS